MLSDISYPQILTTDKTNSEAAKSLLDYSYSEYCEERRSFFHKTATNFFKKWRLLLKVAKINCSEFLNTHGPKTSFCDFE